MEIDNPIISFRFCTYFNETKKRCKNRIAGEWIKKLDNDTLDDIISIAKKIDKNPLLLGQDEELWKDFADLIKLGVLLVEWETGKNFYIDRERDEKEAVDLQTEYAFRLTSLIQHEYNRRNKVKNLVLNRDHRKYKGKLSIYE
jgi:hypothetical protein